jgi:hypothetical protein
VPDDTLAVTGEPIEVEPFRIVNVTVPALMVPLGLVTVAVSGTAWAAALYPIDALAAAVDVVAPLIVSVLLTGSEAAKLAVPS